MKTLFKNACVYDGTGNAPEMAHVLVENDRIVYVGKDVYAAEKVVDCQGLSLVPGFIDAHSHNDFFYDYPNARVYYEPFLRQGITTQVTGNCGFSPFGISADSPHKDKVGAGLFVSRNPGSFQTFCRQAQGNLFVNIAPLVGHGTVRIGVHGLQAGALGPEELEQELAAVEEAMEHGALGGSFGFMYEPGMYASKNELYAFARKIAQYGGMVTVHPRACSKVAMGYPLLSKPHIELALDEVMDIMEMSGCRMEYSHLIFVGKSSWGSAKPMLKKLRKAREKGLDIAYDHYSMTYGASVITVICPAWYMALTDDQKKSPINRFKLRLMVDVTRKLLGIDYQDVTVAYINDDPHYKRYEGRNIREIAESEKKDCLALYLELIDASHGTGKVYLDKYYSPELIRLLMEDDLGVCMTDAWVEPEGVQNGAAFQGYPHFLLLAREYGIPIEKIIHKMTGKTAERFHLKDRGFIKPGYKADITLFSPERLQVFPQEPGRFAEGIVAVYVNGQCALEDGCFADVRCGEVIFRS